MLRGARLLTLALSLSACAGTVTEGDATVNSDDGSDDGRDAGGSVPSTDTTDTVSSSEASGEAPSNSGTDMPPPGTFPDGTPAPEVPVGEQPEECEAADTTDAVGPLTKLSTLQYRNTVRDLLSELGVPELVPEVEARLSAVPDDSRGQLFRALDPRISLEHVEGYFNVAKAIGDGVTNSETLLAQAAGACAVEESPSDACLDTFIDRLGLLAYRRPLRDEERTELRIIAADVGSGRQQVRALIVAALISPHFVNHLELDGAWVAGTEDVLQLSAYEVASRIAYTFWQTMPDAALFAAAADGRLLTESGLEAELERVFSHPRTKQTLWSFWREWLSLDGFTGFELGRPGFQALAQGTGVDEGTYDAMVEEVRLLTEHFTFAAPSTLGGLLETNVSITSSDTLAALYGVSPWSGQGDMPTFPSGERAGLFQRAALLVSSLEQTNPFHRGAFFKRYLMCENLPSPDPAALPPGSLDIPPGSTVQTTRERFESKIAGNSLCTGCHGLFTELGYTLEAFDSLGRFRTVEQVFDEENGSLLAELPLDASATVRVGATSQEVTSPAELNALLLSAGDIESCLAEQYFKFVHRRLPEPSTSDGCVTDEISRAAADEASGLAGAFRRIAELQSFYQRKVGPR